MQNQTKASGRVGAPHNTQTQNGAKPQLTARAMPTIRATHLLGKRLARPRPVFKEDEFFDGPLCKGVEVIMPPAVASNVR